MNSKGKALKKMTIVERVRMQHPERFLSKSEHTARSKALLSHMSKIKAPTEREKKEHQNKIGRAYNE